MIELFDSCDVCSFDFFTIFILTVLVPVSCITGNLFRYRNK